MKDRHRKGYFEEYAKRTGKKDRHRKGYYREYNLKHPERLERVGLKVIDGVVCKEITKKETVKTDLISLKISIKEHQWHDDDWFEDNE